jgi:hypothetical protein
MAGVPSKKGAEVTFLRFFFRHSLDTVIRTLVSDNPGFRIGGSRVSLYPSRIWLQAMLPVRHGMTVLLSPVCVTLLSFTENPPSSCRECDRMNSHCLSDTGVPRIRTEFGQKKQSPNGPRFLSS